MSDLFRSFPTDMANDCPYAVIQSDTSRTAMKKQSKTKAQLNNELVALRQRLTQLETLESQLRQRLRDVNDVVGTPVKPECLQSRSLQQLSLDPISTDCSLTSLEYSPDSESEDTQCPNLTLDNNLPQNSQNCQAPAIFTFPNHPQLEKIFAFIEANYHRSISLNQVAKTFNYSAAYLTSLVRRLTGKTLYQWIVQRRMFQARYLLISSNWSIRKIGETVGYSDPGHFIKQFSQLHHQPPQSWRNTQRHAAS